MKVEIETTVNAPLEKAWKAWTNPDSVTKWNFASEEWHCPKAESELREGGRFKYRMEAKDASMGFGLEGTYTKISQFKTIEFELDDKRKVQVNFEEVTAGIRVKEVFEAENTFSVEQQRTGWQSILDNYKKHVEETQ